MGVSSTEAGWVQLGWVVVVNGGGSDNCIMALKTLGGRASGLTDGMWCSL